MGDFLGKFLYKYDYSMHNPESARKINNEIEIHRKQLKQHLNKEQRKLLLRIEDKNDLLIEKAHMESFVMGFKLGLKIGYETNKD